MTIRYHLLAYPTDANPYRGIDRDVPIGRRNEPLSSPFNNAWAEWSGHGAYVADRDAAVELQEMFRNAGTAMDLVAELSEEVSTPVDAILLGYDVLSHGYHSFLRDRLDAWKRDDSSAPGALLTTLAELFSARLNEHGLFGNRSDAERLRMAVVALKELCPFLFEDDESFCPSVKAVVYLKG